MYLLFIDDNQLTAETQSLLCTTFPDYNTRYIIQIAHHNTPIDDLSDEQQTQYRRIVHLCRRLPTAFQCMCRSLAEHMMLLDDDNVALQECLNRLLQDIRKDMKPSDFNHLYSDELRPYVTVLGDAVIATSETNRELLDGMVLAVRLTSKINFVILITHFPMFLYLKSEAENK